VFSGGLFVDEISVVVKCSYGTSLAVSCNGFNSVIVSARAPYSWINTILPELHLVGLLYIIDL